MTTTERVQHTPGPWGRSERTEIRSPKPGYHLIARVQTSHPLFPAEADANARLIAAAPELLAALRMFRVDAEDECYDACTSNGLRDHGPACLAARAAIRLAEGRASE